MQILNTPDPAYNEYKDAKEATRYKQVLIATELFNMAVDDSDAE